MLSLPHAVKIFRRELTVKMQAIGHMNWLFVGSRAGGCRAATLFSQVDSCKANGVEPWTHLLAPFFPDRWLAAHPQHSRNTNEIRRRERQQKNSR